MARKLMLCLAMLLLVATLVPSVSGNPYERACKMSEQCRTNLRRLLSVEAQPSAHTYKRACKTSERCRNKLRRLLTAEAEAPPANPYKRACKTSDRCRNLRKLLASKAQPEVGNQN